MNRNFSHLLEGMNLDRRARIQHTVSRLLHETDRELLTRARGLALDALIQQLHIDRDNAVAIEQMTDVYISTLRDVLTAMGGELIITISLGDSTSELTVLSTAGVRQPDAAS